MTFSCDGCGNAFDAQWLYEADGGDDKILLLCEACLGLEGDE